jgi:hypothetical protein
MNNVGGGITLSIVTYLLIIVPALLLAEAQTENTPKVFPLNSRPYGTSYAEWTAKFWQWLIEQQSGNNAAEDSTGEKCTNNQRDPNVWFFPGTTGGNAERICTIPAGKAILVSVINAVCSYATDPDLKSEAELRSCVKADQDDVDLVEFSLNGVPLPNVTNYRIQSPLFNVTFPQNNLFQGKPGPTWAVSDGYWVFLEPLQPGNYELSSKGALGCLEVTCAAANFATDVRYHLSVK